MKRGCDFLRKWRHDRVEPRDLFHLKTDKNYPKKLVRNVSLVVITNDSLKCSKCLESKYIVFPIPKEESCFICQTKIA
jgi:hypothetical protein